MEVRSCPECGEELREEVRDDPMTYKGMVRSYQAKGWWCAGCGEGYFAGAENVEREAAYFDFKAEVDRVLSPTRVAAIRARLGLSQLAAGRLLGGGVRSFQKYEAGTVTTSVPMSNLLRLLERHPELLTELETLTP